MWPLPGFSDCLGTTASFSSVPAQGPGSTAACTSMSAQELSPTRRSGSDCLTPRNARPVSPTPAPLQDPLAALSAFLQGDDDELPTEWPHYSAGTVPPEVHAAWTSELERLLTVTAAPQPPEVIQLDALPSPPASPIRAVAPKRAKKKTSPLQNKATWPLTPEQIQIMGFLYKVDNLGNLLSAIGRPDVTVPAIRRLFDRNMPNGVSEAGEIAVNERRTNPGVEEDYQFNERTASYLKHALRTNMLSDKAKEVVQDCLKAGKFVTKFESTGYALRIAPAQCAGKRARNESGVASKPGVAK
jgi:hypothetical protein